MGHPVGGGQAGPHGVFELQVELFTRPLACGWYAVVVMWWIPSLLHTAQYGPD